MVMCIIVGVNVGYGGSSLEGVINSLVGLYMEGGVCDRL